MKQNASWICKRNRYLVQELGLVICTEASLLIYKEINLSIESQCGICIGGFFFYYNSNTCFFSIFYLITHQGLSIPPLKWILNYFYFIFYFTSLIPHFFPPEGKQCHSKCFLSLPYLSYLWFQLFKIHCPHYGLKNLPSDRGWWYYGTREDDPSPNIVMSGVA